MTTDSAMPMPKLQAIAGMYLKISRFTPLLEVNVVEPVKQLKMYEMFVMELV